MDSYEKLSYIIKTNKTKHHLNAWEKEFIDSVQKQLKDTGNLTDRQEYCLDEIYRNSLLTKRKMMEIDERTK